MKLKEEKINPNKNEHACMIRKLSHAYNINTYKSDNIKLISCGNLFKKILKKIRKKIFKKF